MASAGWFATLTNPQLKDLLAAASFPDSRTKAVKMERSLKSPYTSVYDVDDGHDASINNDRYHTVLRLLQKKNPRALLESIDTNVAASAATTADGSKTIALISPPPTKKARLVKVLDGDAPNQKAQQIDW